MNKLLLPSLEVFAIIPSSIPDRSSRRGSRKKNFTLVGFRAFVAAGLIGLLLARPIKMDAQDPPAPLPATPSAALSGQTVSPSETPQAALPPLPPPVLHSASAILIDAVSGQVLYELNADVHRPMASTTKIMTALLFCESVPDDAMISASENACHVKESSLHLKPGEKLKAHDLLRAILMRSANDGCVAAAEFAAGSEAAFVERMNARAAQLGALHTHFTNPHGLHNKNHYTTARDLALIARAAMQEPRIEEVVRCEKCRITRSMNVHDVTMRNHSHFIGHFPGADGVKTGWTIPAGHCYVGSATWGGWRLLTVVLKSKNYVQDTGALMKYGFYHFAPHPIAKQGDPAGDCAVTGGAQSSVPVTVGQKLQFVSRKGEQPQIETRIHLTPAAAPIAAGSPLGAMDAWVDGRQVASSPLIAARPVPVAVAIQAIKKDSPWKRFALTTTIFAVGLVSLRYGTRYRSRIAALAKSARRRRRRLS